VIIVGDADYVRREWKTIWSFPKISVVNASPLSRADLRAVSIAACDMYVVLARRTPAGA